ncbi:MAG: SUMF1/EgtB/PvdO family nonheme iron enzyme, partial [Deltaproteobacteria bacterium]|nr:SUMF1/EgtB/PvdO family nonheme iron enzyme [Deltaproteobacteria bacterium]
KGTSTPEPAACPANMQLVSAEYCSEVEQTCKRSWYDPSNRKVICEEFEAPSRCVGTRDPRRFCIDRHPWPNVPGERPEVMNNFYQAEVKCAAVGKRLCTESEWTLACEGPDMKPFPYGYVRDAGKCNGDHPWDSPDMKKVAARDPAELARLWKGARNGDQPHCVSDFGVADLAANTDDVVASETYTDDFRGKYDSVHTGGPWYRGVRNQCRPKIYTHDEGFYYYFLGFRCCASPDGAPTDPRTPKQVKKQMPFSSVERIARFTVEDVRRVLSPGRAAACNCSPRDVLCRTLCGTLLGPEARDVHREPLFPLEGAPRRAPAPTE